MKPRRADFLSAFLRSFAVQGSWNYQTMIGGGMAFALAPLLARIHAGDPVALREAMERHSAEFNAHPYLSPLAVGALARVEHEREPSETIERFRTAIRGPLGALGDQAVWAGWRPFCVLVAMIAFLTGVGPLTATAGFLLVYNAGHVALRVWSFRLGWNEGLTVGRALGSSWLKRFAPKLVPINVALLSAACVLLIGRLPGGGVEPWMGGVAAGVGLSGYFVTRRVTFPAMAALFLALVSLTL